MVEERVEVRQPDGSVETRTTVHDSGVVRSSGGGSGWLIALVLIVGLFVGGYFLLQAQGSRSARDNAIAEAAENVGQAAKNVGDAAKDVADGDGK